MRCAEQAFQLIDESLVFRDRLYLLIEQLPRLTSEVSANTHHESHDPEHLPKVFVEPASAGPVSDKQHMIHRVKRTQNNDHRERQCVQQSQRVELVIVGANTIIDPPTVDLHLEDTPVALATVVNPLRFPRAIALDAQLDIGSGFELLGDVTWVRQARSEPADKSHERSRSEDDQEFRACR